jgi:iron complex outermembrane receptor protein
MNKITIKAFSIISLSLWFSLLVKPACAAPAQLEEIIVTAQKRLEIIRDVPLSVSVLTGEDLQSIGATNISGIQARLPAVTISEGLTPFAGAIRLRGVGSEGLETSIEPSVGFFIDGVYQPRSGIAMTDLLDIERVEVLYGPQGTLYGKNTNAGVISVTTRRPSHNLESELEVTRANDNGQQVKLMSSGPIHDDLAFRLSASRRVNDGWLVNDFDGDEVRDADDQLLRGQLFWTPTESLDVLLIGYHGERDLQCCDADAFYGQVQQEIAAKPSVNKNLGSNSWDDYRINTPDTAVFDQQSHGLSFHLEYRFHQTVFESITAWDEYDWNNYSDLDRSVLGIMEVRDLQTSETFSQELRLLNSLDQAELLVGLFYYQNELTRGDNANIALVTLKDDVAEVDEYQFGYACEFLYGVDGCLESNPEDKAFLDHEFDQTTYAIFSQLEWWWQDDVIVTLGLRYTYEEKDVELYFASEQAHDGNQKLSIVELFAPSPLGVDESLENYDRTDKKLTWMFNIKYELDEDINTFFTVATGFKAGGFNGFVGLDTDREFDSEDAINYELGLKSSWLNNKVNFDASLFYTEFEDFQTLAFSSATSSFFVDNAGEQRSQGVSLALRSQLNQRLRISAELLYLNAEFTDFEGADCYAGRPVDNPVLDVDGAPGSCDRSGETLDWAPEWSSSFDVSYRVPGNWGEWFVSGSWVYKSLHTTQTDGNPRSEQYFSTVNLRAGLESGPWGVAVWANNVFDRAYFVQVEDMPLLDGSYQTYMAEPRSAGITLRYHYQP